jgi:parallel beta-helix repeat protein
MKTTFTFFLVLTTFLLNAQLEKQKMLQTQFITVKNGETIDIAAGTYQLKGSLWLDGKQNVTIRGAGKDKTILSFKGQLEGAEGIKITNGRNITLEGLTVEDAKGDAVKAQQVQKITFRDVCTSWTSKPSPKNGAYGLYPVQCNDVLIEKCEAIGASDAGIYVGQSNRIIVRQSKAWHNVAGIEIENSTQAEVYDNEAYNNTGGILVFDLPGLIQKQGGNVKVYNNHIHDNNLKNFAPKGNTVATVPPGTGVMVLATRNVEVYGNQIVENKTVGVGIVSYFITEWPIEDKEYNPYPGGIDIHDNSFVRRKQMPTLKNKMGLLFWMKFGKKVPDILYDGIVNKAYLDSAGQLKPEHRICIRNNGNATFANIDAANKFKDIDRDITHYSCSQ